MICTVRLSNYPRGKIASRPNGTRTFCTVIPYVPSNMYILHVYELFSCGQIDGLAQDYSNSIANELELPQSCAKPSIKWFSNGVLWLFYLLPPRNDRSRVKEIILTDMGKKTVTKPRRNTAKRKSRWSFNTWRSKHNCRHLLFGKIAHKAKRFVI